MFITACCPSWTLWWHSVWRGAINIHVLLVHCVCINYSQLIIIVIVWVYDTSYRIRAEFLKSSQRVWLSQQYFNTTSTSHPWCTMYEEYMRVHGSSSDRVPSEGPRGTIIHDEHHVFGTVNQFDRRSMTYTCPSNKWTFSLYSALTNKHKHPYTLLRSLRLNCNSFDQHLRVQSRSKHCRNLHNHHNELSSPSDVKNLKSVITFHVFSQACTCRYLKFTWYPQLSY